jgi:hypothetical protein
LKKLFTLFFVVALLAIALVGCSTNTVERVIVVVTATPEVVMNTAVPQNNSCNLESITEYTDFILENMPLSTDDLNAATDDLNNSKISAMEEHLKDARVHNQEILDYTENANIPSCLDEYNNYVGLWAQDSITAIDKILSGDYAGAADDLGTAADWLSKANDSIQNLLDSNNLNG